MTHAQTHGALALSLLGLLLCPAQVALAHGPPPALLRVLDIDDQGPAALLTSKGLIVRQGEAQLFLCPMRWGGPEAPLALSAGEDLIIFGLEEVYRYERSSERFTALTPELRSGVVLDATADKGGDVWVLRDQSGDASPRLWHIPTGGVPAAGPELDEDWIAIGAAPDALHVATTDATQLLFGRRGPDGETSLQREDVVIEDALGTFPRFLPEPEAPPWLLLRAAGLHRVASIDDTGALTLRARSAVSIDGFLPASEAGSEADLLVTDGRLMRSLDDGSLEALLEPPAERTFTGLGRHPGAAWISTEREVYTLDLSAPEAPQLGERLFAFEDIRRPRLDGLDVDGADLCISEWLDLATEADLDLQRPEAVEDTGAELSEPDFEPEPGCCTAVRRHRSEAPSGAPLVVGLFATLMAGTRRRRGRGSAEIRLSDPGS